jgi:hypothetical protein
MNDEARNTQARRNDEVRMPKKAPRQRFRTE